MKNFYTLAVFLLISTAVISATTLEKKVSVNKERQWFSGEACTSLLIEDYTLASDDKPKKQKTVTDQGKINELKSMIEALPVYGDKMKSFASDVPLVTLKFTCGQKIEEIEFYREQVKTPSTGFLTEKKEEEAKVYKFLMSLF